MNKINYCPECGGLLSASGKNCRCGWRREISVQKRADHRCEYQLAGRRCPSFGIVSPSLSRGSWYCREHCLALDNPTLCEVILKEAEEKYDRR